MTTTVREQATSDPPHGVEAPPVVADAAALCAFLPPVKAITLSNGYVQHVRGMTGAQRDEFDSIVMRARVDGSDEVDAARLGDFRTRLVLWCACKHTGERFFCDGDLDRVAELDPTIRDEIAEAALQISGLGDAVVTDAAKNS